MKTTVVPILTGKSNARVIRVLRDDGFCWIEKHGAGEDLDKETVGAQLLSSALLVLETRRNLVRLARQGRLDPGQYKTAIERFEQDMHVFVLRDLTLDLCQYKTMPAVSTPRSLDLAHLWTALWFHAVEKIDRFITMDASQEQAAKGIGTSGLSTKKFSLEEPVVARPLQVLKPLRNDYFSRHCGARPHCGCRLLLILHPRRFSEEKHRYPHQHAQNVIELPIAK